MEKGVTGGLTVDINDYSDAVRMKATSREYLTTLV
jgi:hypothetical protein